MMRESGGDWAIQISAIEGSVAFLKTLSDRSAMWPEALIEYMAKIWGEPDLARVRQRLDERNDAFNVLWEAGRREEAKDLYREDCRKQSERFGSRSTVAEFMRRTGLVAQRRQVYAFAEACFELSLEYFDDGEAGATAGMDLRLDLARLHREVGRWAEAQAVLAGLLPELRRLFGPANELTCTAVRLLADTHACLGRVGDALEELQRLREFVVDELGPETSELPLTLHAMADILAREQRGDEAFELLREAAAVPVGTTWAEKVEHVELLVAIGRAQVGRAELDAAVGTLERAWSELHEVAPLPASLAAECERALSDARAARGSAR